MIAARFKFRGPEIAKTRQNQPEIQLFANLTNLELEYFNQTWSICVSLLGDKKNKTNFPSRSKVMVIKVEIRSNRQNRPQHYHMGVGCKNEHFQKHRGPSLFDAENCSDK